MNEENLFHTLRAISFLRGVEDEHLEKLAVMAKFVDFPQGKIIFREGDLASQVFLIVHGNVSLEICGPGVGCTQILTVGEGDLLCWSSVITRTQLTVTARTLTATRMIEFNGSQVLDLCEQDPDFGYEFMRCTALTLATRLGATRMQLLDLLDN